MEDCRKKILVTGAGGQLGRSFAAIAGEYPDVEFVFPAEDVADITDPVSMERLIRGCGYSAVINCAAYTAVDKAEDEPAVARKVNADGPAILARLCAPEGITLVHYSTDYVFDGTADEPYSEASVAAPLGVYGSSKLAGEKAVAEAGCDALVIRTSWVYSQFGNNFVATMIRLGREGKALNVVDDQYGTPTFATDLARATMYMLGRGVKSYEALNYNALGDTTWYGFACEVFRQAGIDADISPTDTAGYPAKARRPRYGVLDMGKAISLGVPLRSWQEALADCLRKMEVI